MFGCSDVSLIGWEVRKLKGWKGWKVLRLQGWEVAKLASWKVVRFFGCKFEMLGIEVIIYSYRMMML